MDHKEGAGLTEYVAPDELVCVYFVSCSSIDEGSWPIGVSQLSYWCSRGATEENSKNLYAFS